ncbi:MAG: hypothetical protein C0596_12330 [Marinilabiliales bacterium]|nr:MAG: hypothetical protein C0596_12330 [Marinilabiliales bacterium]
MKFFNSIAVVFLIICISVSFANAQGQDTVLLKEVEIKSSRYSIDEEDNLKPLMIISRDRLKLSSDNDLSSGLKENSLVDIRQRSFSSAQSDLSIRGGSFDQNIILLNGINLSDVQTGHHNLNIPINSTDIDRIELVSGPNSRTFGPNALTGAVNFISIVPVKNSFNLDMNFGSFKTRNIDLGSNIISKNMKHSISLSYSDSDGFDINTDYVRKSLYYENNFDLNKVKLKAMLGLLEKGFGSNSFYTPMYAYQYESIKTGFAALKLTGSSFINWDCNIYYRRLQDQFQLFREGDGFYVQENSLWINQNIGDTISWYGGHNNHLTNILGSGVNLWKTWGKLRSSVGADLRYEEIYSNVLGLDMPESVNGIYTKFDKRENLSVFFQQGYYADKFLFNIGGLAYWNRKYNWNLYYGSNLGYKINDKITIIAGANKAMRLPTFTELYYTGPSNTGNPDLFPESAITFEAGSKFYFGKRSFANFNLFNRRGENIIAWVRETEVDKWVTENLTKLFTYGVEFNVNYSDFKDSFILNRFNISYAYLYQDKSAANLESKYTLDHLKHKLIVGFEHKIYKNISASWAANIFQRNGEYLYFDRELNSYTDNREYKISYLLNCKIKAEFELISVYAGFYNLTNTEYFDIANVPTPGFSFNAGVKLNIQGKGAL